MKPAPNSALYFKFMNNTFNTLIFISLIYGIAFIPGHVRAQSSPYKHYNTQIKKTHHSKQPTYKDRWQRIAEQELQAHTHSSWNKVDQKHLSAEPTQYSNNRRDFKKNRSKSTQDNKFPFNNKYSREKTIARTLNKHELKISQQTFYARYVEPDVMKQRGKMFGVGATYTYRPDKYDPLYSQTINTYRLDGMFAAGEFQYESEVESQTGLRVGADDHMYDLRALLGKELYDEKEKNMVFLYSGYGFRYLSDDDDGSLAFVPGKGYFYGYKRESRYHYIPAGLELTHTLDHQSKLKLNMEYNHLIRGTQFSQLSDGDTYTCCSTDLTNDQHNGYGLRGSLAYEKEYSILDVSFEPFFRYWNIDHSDISTGYFNGAPFSGIEPENETFEVGAKTSLLF